MDNKVYTVDETVLQRVTKKVAEVLALNPEDIEPQSRLIDDLGAESLDLVELMFLLEEEFSIKLDKKDMSLSTQLGLADNEIHVKEVLTDKALGLLKERYPQSAAILVEGTTVKQLAVLLTVEEIARSMERKLKSMTP